MLIPTKLVACKADSMEELLNSQVQLFLIPFDPFPPKDPHGLKTPLQAVVPLDILDDNDGELATFSELTNSL